MLVQGQAADEAVGEVRERSSLLRASGRCEMVSSCNRYRATGHYRRKHARALSPPTYRRSDPTLLLPSRTARLGW